MGRALEDVPQAPIIASGNIAKVLRQARASLKDPSRPFTPTERRLRSTKSLFGDAEFRPRNTESISGPSRHQLNPGHAYSLKRATRGGSKGKQRQNKVRNFEGGIGACLKSEARSRQQHLPLPKGLPSSSDLADWVWAGSTTTSGKHSVSDNFTPNLSSRNDRAIASDLTLVQPPSSPARRGILYLDDGRRKGSRSRSRRGKLRSGSSSSSSSSSSGASGFCLIENTKEAAAERDDYSGLYGSDDDLDTSAWDVDPVCDDAWDREKTDHEPPESGLIISGEDFGLVHLLDAIDNEVELAVEGLGFEDDEEVISQHSVDDSDVLPDPGALEEQRERNARLAGLVRMLRRHLNPAKDTTTSVSINESRPVLENKNAKSSDGGKGGSFEGVAVKGALSSSSDAQISQTLAVLCRVMDKPRGLVDASPPVIAGLPGMLAARLAVDLLLPSLHISRNIGDRDCSNNDEPEDEAEKGGQLMKACKHLFEVSKEAEADSAFFSSGSVVCLLDFTEVVSSYLDSILAAKHGERRARDGGVDKDAVLGVDDEKGAFASTCDALTFAVGCLKNVIVNNEGLQHRLVQAGAVGSLCRLARCARDLCRRCDRVGLISASGSACTSVDGRRAEEELLSEAANRGDDGRRDHVRSSRSAKLRRLISPPLAQSINILCDLATAKDNHERFCAAGAVGILSSILRPFRNQHDVILNSSRTLAKLSLQDIMRRELDSDPAYVRDLLAALVDQGRDIDGQVRDLVDCDGRGCLDTAEQRRYWGKEGKRIATCVRLAFTLGNLTSASDDNRKLIGLRLGGGDILPALLQTFTRAHLAAWERLAVADVRINSEAFEESWSIKTLRSECDRLEEMLVKTVRLIANISINHDVGQHVCRHPGLAAVEPLLEKCLDVFGLFEDGALLHSSRRKSADRRQRSREGKRGSDAIEGQIPGEELLLNVVSLITNLSFYGPAAEVPLPKRCACHGEECACGPFDERTTESPHVNTLFALASRARRNIAYETPPVYPTKINNGGGDAVDGTESNNGVAELPTTMPNLCYLDDQGRGGREVLCGHLVKVLLHPNAEAVTEAARAFGNFSRDPSCREAMARRRGDEVLVALLGHSCREVVFAVAGALVNMAADPAHRALLYRDGVGAGERLARLVRRAGLADPDLSELSCQAMYNMLLEPLPGGGVEEVLGGAETHKQLWWTLRELVDACSFEGRGDGRRDGGARLSEGKEDTEKWQVFRDPGGFIAAAIAVWRAIDDGSVDRTSIPSYEEL